MSGTPDGSNTNDTLLGLAGNDTLIGGDGADSLDGGTGTDFASYIDSGTGLKASLANPSDNTGIATGDTYTSIEGLIGSNFNDYLIGDANADFLQGGLGADSLDGGAGFDYADYFNASAGVVADLANSALSTGEAAGDVYFSIEALRGSEFNDTLIGDAGTNFLRGGLGADSLDGGAGYDYADYSNASTGVLVDLANSALNTGEAAGDTFTSIEGIQGSAFADTLIGDAGNNALRGQAGADSLDGGAGFDFADYGNAATGVVANLANSAVNTGDAAGDTYASIEGIIGSAFNDTLTGDGGTNILRGGLGADVLDGGAGNDFADYSFASAAVLASLATPASNTGEAAGDTYTSIEALSGSDFNDTLIGDSGNNLLDGAGGADSLVGGLGADTMVGGLGNDTCYVDNPGDVVIENTGEGTDTVYTTITYGLTANVENSDPRRGRQHLRRRQWTEQCPDRQCRQQYPLRR
ncbi:calcium-binding protein [Bradyrhizobium sp. 13971]